MLFFDFKLKMSRDITRYFWLEFRLSESVPIFLPHPFFRYCFWFLHRISTWLGLLAFYFFLSRRICSTWLDDSTAHFKWFPPQIKARKKGFILRHKKGSTRNHSGFLFDYLWVLHEWDLCGFCMNDGLSKPQKLTLVSKRLPSILLTGL